MWNQNSKKIILLTQPSHINPFRTWTMWLGHGFKKSPFSTRFGKKCSTQELVKKQISILKEYLFSYRILQMFAKMLFFFILDKITNLTQLRIVHFSSIDIHRYGNRPYREIHSSRLIIRQTLSLHFPLLCWLSWMYLRIRQTTKLLEC